MNANSWFRPITGATFVPVIGTFCAVLLAGAGVYAHPGSGIVVDDEGQVYFVHAEVGVWTVGPEVELRRHVERPAYHFMIADPGGRFAGQRWPRFPDGVIEVTEKGTGLLHASSFPVTIGPDGALYYPEAKDDGQVHILRVMPGEAPAEYATLPVATEIGYDGQPVRAKWIHGLAAGRDGTLYYCERGAIRRVEKDGTVSLVAGDIEGPGCEHPPAFKDDRADPGLRGLDVAADGTIYAAASACSAVIRISPAGDVSAALRGSDGWSPTGVAVVGDDVYVLEFLYLDVEKAGDWLPRVRKLPADGTVTVLATVAERPE